MYDNDKAPKKPIPMPTKRQQTESTLASQRRPTSPEQSALE